MKLHLVGAAMAVAALSLGACATQGMTADQAVSLVKGFHDAGCGGNFGVHAGASTGQLGGQASVNVDAQATCPTAGQPLAVGQTVGSTSPPAASAAGSQASPPQ